MKLRDVYDLLDDLSSFEIQEEWDNSGLQLGSWEAQVERIVLSLDIDAELIETHEEGTLFVVHHPLIFAKLSRICREDYPANLLMRMIEKNQALIAMHTNFDQTHLNRYVCEEVLEFADVSCEGFVCRAKGAWQTRALLEKIRQKLGLRHMRLTGMREQVGSVAITTGAGASLMERADADLFLTGDIKFHDAMKARSLGIMLADIGHFESERFFPDALAPHLKNLPLHVIINNSKNPFFDDPR